MRKLYGLLVLFPIFGFSQDDLLSEIDTLKADTRVESAFKSLKIVNLESTKLAAHKDFYFIVAHRFDYMKNGFDDFFGLDNANTQLKFVYGLKEWLTIHASRSGFQETYDLAAKYRLVQQGDEGFPFTLVGFNSVAVNTEMKKESYPNMDFDNRLSYVTQFLVSRKFNQNLSLELAPTYFHENTIRDVFGDDGLPISSNPQDNSQFAIGVGGRYKLTKRWSVNADYVAHLNRASQSVYRNPLSVGVDLETGGHVFQMHFTNSRAMHETGFLGQTSGRWEKGEICFGFNLVRVF
jgi:opacity protein-like surface antigen